MKVSDQDLQHLGLPGTPLEAAHGLLGRGCGLVVLTLGAEGAWVLSRTAERFAPAAKVRVVDTVGAGDTFFAGFVAFLRRSGSLSQVRAGTVAEEVLAGALAHATASAAINIGRQGCQPPTWAEVEARLTL